MKILVWLTFLFLIHFMLQAQTTITGVVSDSSDNPIPNATVYLSKTTFGVLADAAGTYSLKIPQNGTYELITSCVGYKTHSQIIKADGADKTINIKLQERKILIQEVTVKDKDRNRRKNYELFKICFIGVTQNAPFCTIENPKDLIVYRESSGINMIAYSTKPLIITNSALGYRIIYQLENFMYNLNTKHLRFSGDYYFQDISNQKAKNSRTDRNRLIAYYGSRMHFLRTLFSDSISQENFEMCDYRLDSCGTRWELTNSIQGSDLRKFSDIEHVTLYHHNPIVIFYSNCHSELYPLPNIFRPYTYSTRIIFSDSIQVFKNGYYSDFRNLSWGGAMANRIAEMLPYDFVPKTKGEYKSTPNK